MSAEAVDQANERFRAGLGRFDRGLLEDEPADREGQPCWCPDAFRDHALAVNYCPRHGRQPDPELWDHSDTSEPAPRGKG